MPFDTTGLLQTEGNSGTIATGDTVLRDLFSLFPAYAGVILGAGIVTDWTRPFPRIRGGDPEFFRDENVDNAFSPHMRG